jgi:hypothetical protein
MGVPMQQQSYLKKFDLPYVLVKSNVGMNSEHSEEQEKCLSRILLRLA